MMLLDTHIFLWFVNGDQRLSKNILEQIKTEEDLYVSVITFWELAIKNSLGKLVLPLSIPELMRDCEKMDISILPITSSHLAGLKELPWIHRDPFDRLLICQAQAEGMRLATADENIQKYDVQFV